MSDNPNENRPTQLPDNTFDVRQALWQRMGRAGRVLCGLLCLVGVVCLLRALWSVRDTFPLVELGLYLSILVVGWVWGYVVGFNDGQQRGDLPGHDGQRNGTG